MSLAADLRERGLPGIEHQLAHPTVRGIAAGDLDPDVFRRWLEQDYLFLLDYVRVFSRLAWQAPDDHLGDLVDLAHETFHGELELHRSLAAGFGADLGGATAGPACAAYTSFLLDAAADYGVGLAALYPCMWGYSTLGQRLAAAPGGRYRAWIETYADPGFAALADRIGVMLDEAAPDPAAATAAFLAGMDHELAFWDVPGVSTVADELLAGQSDLWAAIATHPFVRATADGSLPAEAFGRWLVEDHHFVVGFRRFLARLVELAPTEAARDLLAGGLGALQAELDLFRAEAAERGLDLDAEPSLTTLGYTSYLLASPADGWDTAVTVLYGAEKAYFDAWSAVRAGTDPSSLYWRFVDNWSSPAFGAWVDGVAALLTRPDHRTFRRVVRFELQFWDQLLTTS